MGDRCWLTIYVNEEDKEKVTEIFGEEGYQNIVVDKKKIQIDYEEVNYGGYDELKDLAEAKIDFEGNHAAGGCYIGGNFACIDGHLVEVMSDPDGNPLVPCDENGVNLNLINIVKKYYEYYDKFWKE